MAVSIGLFCLLILAALGTDPTLAGDAEQFVKDLEEISIYDDFINDYLNQADKLIEKAEESKFDAERQAALKKIQEKKEEWRKRLEELERAVSNLEMFKNDEDKTDTVLEDLSGSILDDMNKDVQLIKNDIDGMKKLLDNSIGGVDTVLTSVKKSAVSRNVKVAGVVLYGGVGSACTFSTDCVLAHSQCRHGMCQCDPGLSFDSLRNVCAEDCQIYGNSYQFTKYWIIKNHNNKQLDDKSLEECKKECEREDIGFVCRSMDYLPDWKRCYLSEHTKPEVQGSSWIYNSFGIHLQRDCGYTE